MTVHHHESHVTTDEREGPAVALIAVLAILLAVFLIWFFAFSGVVFNRQTDTSTPGSSTTTNTQTNTNTGSSGEPSTVPSPATS